MKYLLLLSIFACSQAKINYGSPTKLTSSGSKVKVLENIPSDLFLKIKNIGLVKCKSSIDGNIYDDCLNQLRNNASQIKGHFIFIKEVKTKYLAAGFTPSMPAILVQQAIVYKKR